MPEYSRPSSRLIPMLLWAGYLLTAAWAVAVRMALFAGTVTGRPFYLRPFAFAAGLVTANAITFLVSLKIARDFPRGSILRRAWLLMVWAAGFGIVRYASMWWSGRRMQSPDSAPPLLAGAQAVGLLAVLLLLAALLMMRMPFVRLGLGRLRWTDWAAAGALLAMVPLLFLLRQNASAGTYRLPLVAAVQQFDPLLIAASAIAGVMFLRVSRDLEGGSLAVSFRYVMCFGMARLLALLAALGLLRGLEVPFTAASLASDWLITIAVFYRWRLTREAGEMARQYEPAIRGRS